MKSYLLTLMLCVFFSNFVNAQGTWNICNSPVFASRVDDVYMVNTQIGYAVCGDGQIVKSVNGGNDWTLLRKDSLVYYRSVEFFNTNIGFIGGFPKPFGSGSAVKNVLKKTTDGGASWTDLTLQLDTVARQGICGLAVADSNTIYGCGNWYESKGYIIKSTNRGNTWTFIDMSSYATSLIDMHFINKDTGFVTGKGLAPLETSIILYTTNGGQTWTNKFVNTNSFEYCWKIQRVTNKMYVAAIEEFDTDTANVLKSTDGGMTWNILDVVPMKYNIEGIGFIDTLKGWTGGDRRISFETRDGGNTWDSIPVCPSMNRVIKVNDTMLFASGNRIWRYRQSIPTGIINNIERENIDYASIKSYPNPVRDNLNLEVTLNVSTRALIILFDSKGTQINTIDNADKYKGKYTYNVNTSGLPAGTYYIVLKIHEDKKVEKIIITR